MVRASKAQSLKKFGLDFCLLSSRMEFKKDNFVTIRYKNKNLKFQKHKFITILKK